MFRCAEWNEISVSFKLMNSHEVKSKKRNIFEKILFQHSHGKIESIEVGKVERSYAEVGKEK